jgi:hypothetical protein
VNSIAVPANAFLSIHVTSASGPTDRAMLWSARFAQ